MKNKFTVIVNAIVVVVMLIGSTLAFAEPANEITVTGTETSQVQNFSSLTGIEAETLTNNEMSTIEGQKKWNLVWKAVKLANKAASWVTCGNWGHSCIAVSK